MPNFSSLLGSVAAGAVAPLVIAWLRPSRGSGRESEGYRYAEFSTGYKACMLLCCAFFFALLILAQLFPGRTKPEEMFGILCVFAGFSLLGLFTYCLMLRMTIQWNDQLLRGANALGRRREMLWSEVERVEYLEWAQAYRITGKQQATIWAYPMMAGFDTLLARLQQYLPRLGPPPGPKPDLP